MASTSSRFTGLSSTTSTSGRPLSAAGIAIGLLDAGLGNHSLVQLLKALK
jgi:hypothetical protein